MLLQLSLKGPFLGKFEILRVCFGAEGREIEGREELALVLVFEYKEEKDSKRERVGRGLLWFWFLSIERRRIPRSTG